MNSAAAAAVYGLWHYTSVVCFCLCLSAVRDQAGSADNGDRSPPMMSTVKREPPYLSLTPDAAMSSGLSSPLSVSATDIQCRGGSSVTSLPNVGVSVCADKQRKSSSSLTRGHTRHRSVDFALANIVPDLSETIETDFLHADRSVVLIVVNLYSIALSHSAYNVLGALSTAEAGTSLVGDRSWRC